MKARLPQGMGGGAQNMQNMIKQAQKMQAEITMNGRKQVQSLNIKPEVVDKDDVEMLQDLLISAINECVKQIEDTSEAKMGAVTGGVSFPGLF